MQREFIVRIPVLVDMAELKASGEAAFVRERLGDRSIRLDDPDLAAETAWFKEIWRAQVALQDALITQFPDILLQYFGEIALHDLRVDEDRLPPLNTLNDVLTPAIDQLGLAKSFFPQGIEREVALSETALNLLEATQLKFGVPSIEAKGIDHILLGREVMETGLDS